VAGVARMRFAQFVLSVCAGAILWVLTLVISGFFFGTVPFIRNHLTAIVLGGIGLGVGSLVASTVIRALRSRKSQ
jgi:membrane-associated protein